MRYDTGSVSATTRGALKSSIARGLLVAAALAPAAGPARAVEGGSGAYLLGSRGFLGGVVPGPGVYWTNDFVYITGEVPQISIGGIAVTNAELDAKVYKYSTTFVGRGSVLGGTPAFNLQVPVIRGDIAFDGALGGMLAGTLRDDAFGVGDVIATPMIGWHDGNWHYNASLSVFFPTGDYEPASINAAARTIDVLSVGKNKFAFDPALGVTYLDPVNGFEASGTIGVTFNAHNPATDYTTAPEFHVEAALAQHFPNGWILGAIGYVYQQIGEDSGAGADSFKLVTGAESLSARVFGIGPVVQYSTKAGDVGLSLQFKYVHEFGARRRFESDVFWGTVSFAF